MKIDSLEQIKVDGNIDWSPDNDNWVNIDDTGRLMSMMSIPARITNLKYNEMSMINLGYINQPAYNMMKKCMLAKGAVCYVDTVNEEINYARLVVNIGSPSLSSVPEILNVNISCEGESGALYQLNDIQFNRSKQFKKKLRYKVSDEHVTSVNDKYIYNYNIQLLDLDTYNFKISAMYQDVKLKCYLNCTRSY